MIRINKISAHLRWIAVAVTASFAMFAQPAHAASGDCARLGGGAKFGNATVILAQYIEAGNDTAGDGARLKDLPPFCRIFAVASPVTTSHVLIELWMPDAGNWNGKLLGIGNGGHAGKFDSSGLARGIRRGYATATTDMGSAPAAITGIEFNFGNGRPDQIKDFGHRATHAMTVLSKDVIARFYGKAPARSFFVGCSTGGNQALSEAQKYPEDYDGIIAGAPAHNRTHMHIHFSALRQLGTQPGAAIPAPLMSAWTRAIIKACAGRDGGAPSDNFLTNPLQCTVSPRQLSCKGGNGKTQCLSEVQISALEKVYAGMRNQRTGQPYYFPDVRGAEELIFPIYDSSLLPSSGYDITRWILPPDRPSSSFDFDRDLTALDDAYAADLNAMNPDLTSFASRGGKLIMYHGWADGIITPIGTIDYYQQITARGQTREDYARLFLVPGLAHCAGGAGATDIGQLLQKTGPANDLLDLLERWVERGDAPDEIIAGKTPTAFSFPAWESKAPTPESRPVCAYPKLPHYDGKGDPLKASSFKCAPAKYPKYPRPAAQYLR